jgi:nucleotide-binding universal stress UspA family protein
MERQPILVAVDMSPEAAAAAAFGSKLAHATGARCQLVHAVRDPWAAALLAEMPDQTPEFTRALYQQARAELRRTLEGRVSAEELQDMVVQAGRPDEVLAGMVQESRAGLIVLGGKHHSALGRWFGGSTSLNVARTATVPLLVTAGAPAEVQRVLVALDSSGAARHTLEAARRLVKALGAELRILSVIEPLPVMPESAPAVDPTPYYDLCRDTIEAELRPLVETSGGELVVRLGPTVATIEQEAAAWHADLVVVGSHGKSFAQRLMLGSVTERLLNHLPTSLVVVPVSVRVPAAQPAPALVPALG